MRIDRPLRSSLGVFRLLHLLDRRLRLLVHLAPALVDSRLSLVDRHLPRLELVSFLCDRARFVQPLAQFRRGIGLRGRLLSAQLAVESTARNGDPTADQELPASHEADATMARLPALPVRRATRAATTRRSRPDRRELIGTVSEYEILLLLDPDLTEDRQNEIVSRIRENVERGGGTWDGHDVWGRRKLAYEIAHKGEGFYHLLLFSSTAEALDEIARVLRITDGVLRHMAVRRLKTTPAPQPAPRAEEPEPEAEAVQEAG